MADTKKEATGDSNNKAESKKEENVDANKDSELSEEDQQLKNDLEMLLQVLKEPKQSLYPQALESLQTLIKAATTSMTSVPKPLKFLRPHYDTIKEIHLKIADAKAKRLCSDIVSVLGMTMPDGCDCLIYRLTGSHEEIGVWGHEYVRHLTGEVAHTWSQKSQNSETPAEELDQLRKLANQIVPYLMSHNAEADACDLLMEMEALGELLQYVDESAYPRVCLYLSSCVPYVPDPDNVTLLKTCLDIFRKFNRYPEALKLAIQLNDMTVIQEVFMSCTDKLTQKQMAYMLGRQQLFLSCVDEDSEEGGELVEIMSNTQLNNSFLALARELDIMEPKVPEDVYKSHLEPSRVTTTTVDSARANLSSSFVNGLLNCAFGQDKLLSEEGNKWLYKNKEHGMMSATATLGLLLLWDVDGGLTQIDKYLYSNEDYIKAGALLACGIVNSGVKNDCDPALALLSDYPTHSTSIIRIGSILGLGLAYAGSNREDVLAIILPVLSDPKSSMEIVGIASLACGLISVGSCNSDVTCTIMQALMEKSTAELKSTFARFMPLGLALTFLGKQDAADATIAALQVVSEPIKSMGEIMVDICAYAGTGNVLKIQKLLHICSEHFDESKKEEGAGDESKDKKDAEKDKKKDGEKAAKDKGDKSKDKEDSSSKTAHQGVAVLGIALIAMGEEIGTEMCYRTFGHLLRYGEPVIKRTVPLGLALLSVSNPKLQVLDTLSKFSHDSDPEVAANSIFAMGIVGAGTNNARLAAMLRQLAIYHSKDANNLYMVRLAQGLCHLGKGTLTLSPYHCDRTLIRPVAVAGLLSLFVSCLDVKTLILGKHHYLLYTLVAAIQPRMLVTFDENLRPLPVQVRVGQAVDVVGQAGRPKTITGFQTHTTPVLLAHGERAELATEEFLSLTPVMEGFVLLKKNPDYEQ